MNTIIKLILKLHHASIKALDKDVSFDDLTKLKVKEEISRAKYIPEEDIGEMDKIANSVESEIEILTEAAATEEVYM